MIAIEAKVGTREWLGNHITNREGKDTFEAVFNDRLYDLFASQFGPAILHDFGYAQSSLPPNYFAASSAASEESAAASDWVAGVGRPTPRIAGGIPLIHARRNADGLYALGDKLLAADELDSAREAFEGSLKFDGKRISTLGRLADVNSRLGRYEDAITYYRRIESLTDVIPEWVASGLAYASNRNAAKTPGKGKGGRAERGGKKEEKEGGGEKRKEKREKGEGKRGRMNCTLSATSCWKRANWIRPERHTRDH